MKILAFCYEYPPIGGGAGNALCYLTREYVRQGHAVTVVTTHFKDLPKVEIQDGVKIIRLKAGRKSIFRGRVREMMDYLIKTFFLSNNLYSQEKPDICIGFLTLPGGLAPLKLWRRHRVPYVTELRGGDVPGFDPHNLGLYHALTKPLIHRIWRQSSFIISNGQSLKELAQKSLSGLNIHTVHNGVDADFFTPAKMKRASETFQLLYVGRFVESQKDISTLIRALPQISNTILHLAGDGPDRDKLVELAKNKGVIDSVIFHGWLDQHQLLMLYQSADVFVSASRYEGLPNAVLQAMACALPLVISNIKSHQELIPHMQNGYLFNNEAELKESLLTLRNDPTQVSQKGRQSRELVLKEFMWKQVASKHLSYFQEAIKQPNVKAVRAQ